MRNTYACKKAIKNSKPITQKIILKMISAANQPVIVNAMIKFQQKPARIFIKACPAIIFANNRIDKLKTRAKYDTNSTTISKGLIKIGLLVGKNIFKNSIPLRRIPNIFTPIKKDNARKNVTLK